MIVEEHVKLLAGPLRVSICSVLGRSKQLHITYGNHIMLMLHEQDWSAFEECIDGMKNGATFSAGNITIQKHIDDDILERWIVWKGPDVVGILAKESAKLTVSFLARNR